MMEKQQQLLAKELFSPQITKFRRETITPLYKDETWSADLIKKSSLSEYNNNYKFILTVIDIFTKYAWAIPLKKKSGFSITNGFKIVLSEHPQGGSESRKPEKLWVDRGSEFYKRTFKSLLKEYETKLYSTYSDLKAVFIERFNGTLLHIINKPNNWLNKLNDAVITFNNKIHSAINMTPIELRKGEFDKFTTKTLQLNEARVNDELINEFTESANEVTNTVNFCNKVAADTISKYNQLKQEFDNNKFNQNITNIHLDDMFTNGLRKMKKYNKSLRKVIVQYIIAILLRSTLVDIKEKARLEMHYGFKQKDIMKEIERIFTNENK